MKRIISMVLAVVMMAAFILPALPEITPVKAETTAPAVYEVFVKSDGSETGEGTATDPVATIQQAYRLINTKRGSTATTVADNVIVVMDDLGTAGLEKNGTNKGNTIFNHQNGSNGWGGHPVTITGKASDGTVYTDAGFTFGHSATWLYYFTKDVTFDNIELTFAMTTNILVRGCKFTVNDTVTTVNTANVNMSGIYGNEAITLNGGTWTNVYAAYTTTGAVVVDGAEVENLFGAGYYAGNSDQTKTTTSSVTVKSGKVQNLYAAYAQNKSSKTQNWTITELNVNISGGEVTNLYFAGKFDNTAVGTVAVTNENVEITGGTIGNMYLGGEGNNTVSALTIQYPVGGASVALALDAAAMENFNKQALTTLTIAKTATPTTGFNETYKVTLKRDTTNISDAVQSTVTVSMPAYVKEAYGKVNSTGDEIPMADQTIAFGTNALNATFDIKITQNGQAKIGETYYDTLTEALQYAQAGQTVELMADVDIPDDVIVLKAGVQLKLGTHSLTAKAAIGEPGAAIGGTTEQGKLYVAKGMLKVDAPFTYDNKEQSVPVWIPGENDDNGYYTFTKVKFGNLRLTERVEGTLNYTFSHHAYSAIDQKLATDGAAPYGLSIKVKLTWTAANQEYNLICDMNEAFIKDVANQQTNRCYSITLPGYAELGIDLQTNLTVTAMVISETGATVECVYQWLWEDLIDILDFESGALEPMAKEGEKEPIIAPDTSRENSNYVLQLDHGVRVRRSATVTQTTTGDYKITGWMKKENANTSVSLKYWYATAGGNAVATVPVGSNTTEWQYFEVVVNKHAKNTTTLRFDLLNNAAADGNAVYFDDLRYMRAMEDPYSYYELLDWNEKLAKEEAESQKIITPIDDPYAEQDKIGNNLIKNGDFSTNTGYATFDKWNGLKNGTNYELSIVDGVLYAKATNTDSSRVAPGTYQTVTVEKNATYQIKFKYKIDPQPQGTSWYGPYASVTWGESGKKTLLRADGAPGGIQADGQWHEFTQSMVAPGTSLTITLCTWLYAGNQCWIDDVEFYKVADAPKMELDLLTNFFYTDMDQIPLSVKLYANQAGSTVTFDVYDGQNMVWSGTDSDDYSVEIDRAACLTKTGVPYVVKATLKDSTGAVLDVATEDIFIYDRPAYLDADGNLVVNGEKQNIHIAHSIDRKDEIYTKVAESGCNVMMLKLTTLENVLWQLDFCENYGYMGIFNVSWELQNVSDAKRQSIIGIVSDSRVRNHQAMLGYCVADEPWSYGAEESVAESLEEIYRLIRKYDQKNLICSINNMFEYHDKAAKYCDVMYIDHYEAPAGGAVFTRVQAAANAAGGRMPVWTVVNAYKDGNYYPTADQARNTIYQSFMAGSTGIGYYSISYSDYTLDEAGQSVGVPIWNVTDANGNPIGAQLWQGLKDFNNKEKDIVFDYYSQGNGTCLAKSTNTTNNYMYEAWQDNDGNIYLVVLNLKADQNVSVNISLSGATSAVVINGSENAPTVNNGTVGVTLAANQTVLYQINP